jgi:hypothetical protein
LPRAAALRVAINSNRILSQFIEPPPPFDPESPEPEPEPPEPVLPVAGAFAGRNSNECDAEETTPPDTIGALTRTEAPGADVRAKNSSWMGSISESTAMSDFCAVRLNCGISSAAVGRRPVNCIALSAASIRSPLICGNPLDGTIGYEEVLSR